MVLTITLVNGNGGQPTPVASASDGQEIQWSSANDLVQLMSGQTFTGLLNPDGTITIPHLATAQHQQNHHHHHQQQHQLDPNNPNANSNMQQQHNVAMSSPGSLATTTISSSAPFQYCRNVKLETNGQPSNSLSNIQAISSSDLSNINIINNNNNNDLNNSAFMNNISHLQQQQQQQSQSATQVKKTIQKRLTAKQKQALQQQQQQQLQLQNQQTQQQQMESMQSPDMRQPQQIITSNPDQSTIRSQQPQVVATVQLPNGQIGQLIAPSGGFWSPNALDLQQLSMAVAAATGTMPQPLSLPISGGQSAISIGNSNQQHVQIASNQHTQMQQSSSQHINSQGLAGSVSQSPSLSTGSGQVANAMIQRGAQQQFQSGNLQIAQQQQQHSSLQIQMQQEQSGSQQTNQSLATTSPGADSSPSPLSSQPSKKLKRLACTCPNCRDGENNRSSGDKKKQHICHFPDCNKVYGKTSHLRAHLRWHSGERPYICGWSFCGKKFTRSDELQRHRRTHTGEKRFQCQECNKRFMRSDHLSKHLKTHLSSKKCGNTSQQSPLLDSTQTF